MSEMLLASIGAPTGELPLLEPAREVPMGGSAKGTWGGFSGRANISALGTRAAWERVEGAKEEGLVEIPNQPLQQQPQPFEPSPRPHRFQKSPSLKLLRQPAQ